MSNVCHAQHILYGLTRTGGKNNKGVPYQINIDGTNFLSFRDFDGTNGDRPGLWGRMTQYEARIGGKIFMRGFAGISEFGNANANGARFDIAETAGGTYVSSRYTLTPSNTGIHPTGGFLNAMGGLLWTTSTGGRSGGGGLLSTEHYYGNGSPVLMASFNGSATGRSPKGTPVLGIDGGIYGTTEFGGIYDLGVIYRFDKNAGLTKILDFDGSASGANPTGNLLMASDGRLYGMADNGGATGNGVIFSVALDGSDYRKLLDFNNQNGAHPQGSLVEYTDGKMYGMTTSGGIYDQGTIFSITPSGQYLKVHDFAGTDGKSPYGDLLVDTEGVVLYGTTYEGGANNKGVLFKLSGGQFTKLYDYDERTGSNPVGTLTMKRKQPQLQIQTTATAIANGVAFDLKYQSAGMPVHFASSDTSIVGVVNNQLIPRKSGTVIISAIQLGNHEYLADVAICLVTVVKQKQTITFDAPPPLQYGGSPIVLSARASSGLPVKFATSVSSVATVEDNILTIRSAGLVDIIATQIGNEKFGVADKIVQSILVKRADQNITVDQVPFRLCCDMFNLRPTSSAGIPLNFQALEPVKLRIDGNTITPQTSGKSDVLIYNQGNNNYNPVQTIVSVDIRKTFPTNNLYVPSSITFGNPPVFASAVSNAGPVTLTSEPPGIAVIEQGKLYALAVGTTTITASHPGNDKYYPATRVSAQVTVLPPVTPASGNDIVWELLEPRTLADAPFNLLAYATSGLPVTYTSSNPEVARISGNQVTIQGTGSTTITAIQPGDGVIPAAAPMQHVLQVSMASQSVNLSIESSTTFGGTPITLPPTSYQGLPLTYTVSNPAVAFIENYYLTFKSAGIVTVTAIQEGNATFLPLPATSKTVRVNPNTEPVAFGVFPVIRYGDEPIDLIAYSVSGMPVAFSSNNTGIVEVSGSKLIVKSAGNADVTARINHPGYNSFSTQYITVYKRDQAIHIDPISDKKFGDPSFLINASSTSNLPLEITTSTPDVVSVNGRQVTIGGNGEAVLTVSQPGNSNYVAATPVTVTFSVEDTGNTYDMLGTAKEGGPNSSGVVYSMSTDGKNLSHLRQFEAHSEPAPTSGFIKGSDGYLYSVLGLGGQGNAGRIVRLDLDGTNLTALHEFTRVEGSSPIGNVCEGSDGFLYGVTNTGGINNVGTIFRIRKDGSSFAVMYHFSAASGRSPLISLTEGSDGKLYGATSQGGFYNGGTLFSIDKNGKAFSILLHMDPSQPFSGYNVAGELLEGPDDFLYGAMSYGGSNRQGIIFKISHSGEGFAVLKSLDVATGVIPAGGVVLASNGSLYGLTRQGGANGAGVIYSLQADGSDFRVILNFSEDNESSPQENLVEGTDGLLYGASCPDAFTTYGFVFAVAKDGTGYRKLIDFDSQSNFAMTGPLLESMPGKFIGSTKYGGMMNAGTIFQITASGEFTIFHQASKSELSPRSLIEDEKGDFLFGILLGQSVYDGGSIFRISKNDGRYEKIYDAPVGERIATIFCASTGDLWVSGDRDNVNFIFRMSSDGTDVRPVSAFTDPANYQMPASTFVETSEGTIYGASPGGLNGTMVFSIKNDATGYRKVYQFPQSSRLWSEMLLAADNNLYLAPTSTSIYRLTQTGTLTSIFQRDVSTGKDVVKIIELNNGRLGIATSSSGSDDMPSIYSVEKDGSNFKLIYTNRDIKFDPVDLEQTMDGWLYVSCDYGGAHDDGMIFKIRPDGSSYTVVREFEHTDLSRPGDFMFKKAPQFLTFLPLADRAATDPGFFPDIRSSSGAPVVITSSNPEVATIENGKIVPRANGETVITARLFANANFYDGGFVSRTLVVTRKAQTITLESIPDKLITMQSFELKGYSSSGLPISYNSDDPAIASIVGSTVILHAVGTTTVTAKQGGNDEFSPAESVSQQLTVIPRRHQVITFNKPDDLTFSMRSFELTATSTSGLAVTYTTSSSNIALEDNLLTVLAPGKATVIASQHGNDGFDRAQDVSQTFCINPVKPSVAEGPLLPEQQLISSSALDNQWFIDNGILPSENDQVILPEKQGSYTVQVSVEGCHSAMSASVVVLITALEESSDSGIEIYPNPATDKLLVSLDDSYSSVDLKLTTPQGRAIQTWKVEPGSPVSLDISAVPAGIYLLQWEHNGKTVTHKVLKK